MLKRWAIRALVEAARKPRWTDAGNMSPRIGIASALMVANLAAAVPSAERADMPPLRLQDTGLYRPGTLEPGKGVHSYSPQYPLWSDGATKRRWIWLPPGTSIDAAQPDAWQFPPGTRLWKEFAMGRRIETRFIERRADGGWNYATYVWNEAGTEALLAPDAGVRARACRRRAAS